MIKYLNFFKTTNKFICLDFDKDVVKKVLENDHPSLKIIHIFAFNWDKVDIKSLRAIAPEARKRNITIIIHCPWEPYKYELKRRLKGIKKDRTFHFSLMWTHKDMVFSLGEKKELQIQKNGTISIRDNDEKILIKTWRV